jgi:hypothetical protein
MQQEVLLLRKTMTSGFGSRNEEEQYDLNLDKIVAMLCEKMGDLLDLCQTAGLDLFQLKGELRGVTSDHKNWARRFMDTVKQLCKKEKHKLSMPKYYKTLYPLACRVRTDYLAYRDF